MFIWTFLLRITHTIISQSPADSSWITLYTSPSLLYGHEWKTQQKLIKHLTRPNEKSKMETEHSKRHWIERSTDAKTILNSETISSSPDLLLFPPTSIRIFLFHRNAEEWRCEDRLHISSVFPSTKNDFRLSSPGRTRLSTVLYKDKSQLLQKRHLRVLLAGSLLSNHSISVQNIEQYVFQCAITFTFVFILVVFMYEVTQ